MQLRSDTLRNYGNSSVAFLIIAMLAGLSFFLVYRSAKPDLLPYRVNYMEDYKIYNRAPHYCDLDSDGNAEFVIFNSYSGVDVLEIFDENESFVEVYHISGRLLDSKPSYLVSDTDSDGKAELYVASVRNDSILLNGYEITGDDGHFMRDHYLSDYQTPDEGNNIRLVDIRPADMDQDGSDEIVMVLRAGLSLSPRMICSVDPWDLSTNMTEKTAASYVNMMLFSNQEGAIERVVTGTAAFENYDVTDSVCYNDNSGWIIQYSPDLSRVLFSREYPENKSYVYAIMKHTRSGPFVYAMIVEMNNGQCFLEKISPDGALVKRVPAGTGMDKYHFINTIFQDLDPLVVLHSDSLFYYDSDLNLQRTEPGAGLLLTVPYGQSSLNAREAGYLLFASGDNLFVRDTAMNIVARRRVHLHESLSWGIFSVKKSDPPDAYIFGLTVPGATLHFRFSRNGLYPFRIPIYLLLYFLLFIGFYGIFMVQNYFYTRRQMNVRKIAELQLQTVQNQLHPHFTFNVLNTIGSMIYQDKKEKAYEYLNYFSDMLRSTLLSRATSEWQLGEELSFISTYMDMENLRFDNRFRYSQQVEKGTDLTYLLPKMSVQAFVENAVRHGLMHKDKDCRLLLRIHENETHLVVEVEDNGIGRKAAGALQRHGSGIGNEILRDYMEVYNRIHKTKFIFTIQDLVSEDGSAAGTKVILLIPKDFRSEN